MPKGSSNTQRSSVALQTLSPTRSLSTTASVYVTVSANGSFPATPGSFQPIFGGGSADAFVARIDENAALGWATHLGGIDIDVGFGIAVDREPRVPRPDLARLADARRGRNRSHTHAPARRGSRPLRDVPVVLITAQSGAENTAVGFAAGDTDYLTKPSRRRPRAEGRDPAGVAQPNGVKRSCDPSCGCAPLGRAGRDRPALRGRACRPRARSDCG
jgi:hypothetical protein